MRDRVAAREGRGGGEGAQCGAEFGGAARLGLQGAVDELPPARHLQPHQLGAALEHRLGAAQGGPRAELLELRDVVAEAMGEAGRQPRAQLRDEGPLLGDVRHDALRRVGRGGGPEVGDVVEQRTVVLVADRADDGSGCRGHRPQHLLVAEAEQGLRVAAAAGDDDDIDLGVGVEDLERRDRLGHAPVALHRRVDRAEPHLRPAELGVAQHVFLGIRLLAGDEPDDVREEGERLLAGRVEQALAAELRAQPLEAFELVAEADVAHRRDREGEVAGLDEVVGFDARDDVIADLQVARGALQRLGPEAERDRRVGVEVFQPAEHVAAAQVPAGDLALDPDEAPLLDEAADRVVEAGHRGGGVDGRFPGVDRTGRGCLAGRGIGLEDRHRGPSLGGRPGPGRSHARTINR